MRGDPVIDLRKSQCGHKKTTTWGNNKILFDRLEAWYIIISLTIKETYKWALKFTNSNTNQDNNTNLNTAPSSDQVSHNIYDKQPNILI